jgi:three-Cys-motif partner protein
MAQSVVGPWAKDKLDRLAKYLHAYTVIMKDQSWCEGYHYIDAFAGPGEHQIRQHRSAIRDDAQQALLDISGFGSEQEEQQQQFLARTDNFFPRSHRLGDDFLTRRPMVIHLP